MPGMYDDLKKEIEKPKKKGLYDDLKAEVGSVAKGAFAGAKAGGATASNFKRDPSGFQQGVQVSLTKEQAAKAKAKGVSSINRVPSVQDEIGVAAATQGFFAKLLSPIGTAASLSPVGMGIRAITGNMPTDIEGIKNLPNDPVSKGYSGFGGAIVNSPINTAAEAGIAFNTLNDATPEQRLRASANLGAEALIPHSPAIVKAVARPIVKAISETGPVKTAVARGAAKAVAKTAEEAADVKAAFRPKDPATVTSDIPVTFRPKVEVPKAEPKPKVEAPKATVSHADTDEVRKLLGMEDRAKTVRKDSELMESAKKHDAFAVASKVNKGEAVSDAEQIAMGVKLQGLRKELDAAREASDVNLYTEKFAQAEELATALDQAGSEAGRAMRARRILIDEQFDEFGLKRMLEKDKGAPLTVKESKQIEDLVKQNKDLSAKLAQTQKEFAEASAKETVKSVSRRAPRFKKEELDAELDSILKEFKETTSSLGAQANDITQVIAKVGSAGTKLVYKVAVNYAKRGVNNLDELVEAVGKHFSNLTREDLVDIIAHRGGKGEPRTASELAKRIGQLQKEAKVIVNQKSNAAREALKEADRLERAGRKAEAKALRDDIRTRFADQDKTRKAENAPFERESELQARIDWYTHRIKTGDFDVTPKELKAKTSQIEMLEAQRDLTRKRFESLRKTAKDESSKPYKAFKGVTDAIRGTQLGFDLGAMTRQGLFGISHPTKMLESIKNGFKAMPSDVALQAIENGINKKLINGKPAIAVRSKSGLYMADTLSQGEEAFVSGLIKKVPILGKVYEGGERFTTGFLNTYRAEMFDWFAKMHPTATENELKNWAKWINSTSGRSNLKEVSPIAQALLTSPRFAASRYETIGRIIKSGTFKDASERQIFKEAVKTAATVLGVMKTAEAAGAKIEWDPESSDFLKIRTGETIYDPTAGIGPSIRFLARTMIPLKRASAPVFGKDTASEVGKTVANKSAPWISMMFEQRTGASLTGFEVPEDEKGWNALLPIIVAQAKENIKKDGWGQGLLKTVPELVGVGASNYPRSEPKRITKD